MRSLWSRSLALCALFAAACSGKSDPCASVKGTCVALEVLGHVEVNDLRLSATGVVDEMATSVGVATSLPVQLSITFANSTSGSVHLVVTGDLNGVPAGSGSTDFMVVPGKHTRATVTLASVGDLGVVDQSAPTADMVMADLIPACVPSCLSNTQVQTCGETDLGDAGSTIETCQYGCIDDATGPHCQTFVPTAPVTPDDVQPNPLLLDVVTAATSPTVVDEDTGMLSHHSGTWTDRPANADPTVYQVINGIGFQLVNGVGVFTAKSFDVPSTGSILFSGTSAVAFAAAGAITIDGVIDARPYGSGALCTQDSVGPGGYAGGHAGTGSAPPMLGPGSGKGPGGGNGGQDSIGDGGKYGNGGGGGHGDKGGTGAIGTALFAAAGGLAYTTIMTGGSGGGGGATGASSSGLGGGYGGGGGGAVQIVSGTKIVIGSASTAGGINAGGCGGGNTGGVGGGGSGGYILLEAPTQLLEAHGVLAANGGAGTGGAAATFDNVSAGGSGGAGGVCQGAAMTGGGAAGIVTVRTLSMGLTQDNAFVISPGLTSGCASTGTITLK